MSREGYKDIQPLGGHQDKGRDAIHHDKTTGTDTIFTYSVREDWNDKLNEDLKKINVPTLILHGDADQIVPIEDSALLSQAQRRLRRHQRLEGNTPRSLAQSLAELGLQRHGQLAYRRQAARPQLRHEMLSRRDLP